MAKVDGQIRIIAYRREDAEELAGWLNRITRGRVWFYRPQQGRSEWLVYGEIELPPEEDTRIQKEPSE